MAITYSDRRDISPTDIQDLRRSIGWSGETDDAWHLSLRQARVVISAWDENVLVGICFLSGLELTGLVSDFVVRAGYQRRAIGSGILRQIMEQTAGMQNVFLFYEEGKTELQAYYARFGFVPVSNGMVYRPSAAAAQ